MASDSETLREAQRVFVRLRLDVSVVHLRFEHGVLHVSGRFCYPYTVSETTDVNVELLHELHRQLHDLDDVKATEYDLKNWIHTAEGGWAKRRIRRSLP